MVTCVTVINGELNCESFHSSHYLLLSGRHSGGSTEKSPGLTLCDESLDDDAKKSPCNSYVMILWRLLSKVCKTVIVINYQKTSQWSRMVTLRWSTFGDFNEKSPECCFITSTTWRHFYAIWGFVEKQLSWWLHNGVSNRRLCESQSPVFAI